MCDACGCEPPPNETHRHGDSSHGQRTLTVQENLLDHNDALAADNRALFAARRICTVNLLSSPGSGKTTLLEQSIRLLQADTPVSVIEGDQQTDRDAVRIRATGAAAIQINTGTGCHLDAAMIGRAMEELAPPEQSLLFIENVGNLVCPAMFDLGEAYKVVIVSVTEGEDKPEKYPHMFRAADICLINKIDLLPHLDFDMEHCRRTAARVNPNLTFFELSARTGEGMAAWTSWLRLARQRYLSP